MWHILPDCDLNNINFFFQAEDGIRDYKVTGVQTCALPISIFAGSPRWMTRSITTTTSARMPSTKNRSEERRVGKESRSRGGPGTQEEKKKCQERKNDGMTEIT